MSMLEHLYELRDRIIKCAVAIAIGAVAAWFLYPQIFDILLEPYCDLQGSSVDDCLLLQTEPLEGFSVRLKIAGYGGIALAMPVLLWQIWRFVTPGLYRHEKKWAYPFVFSAMVLFLLGAGLAFYSLTPALEFLVNVGGDGLNQEFRPAPYFELITYMMLAFGVGFEFPIVLIFLQLAGIVQATDAAQVPPPRHPRHRRPGRGHHPVGRPLHARHPLGPDVPLLRDVHPHRHAPDPEAPA